MSQAECDTILAQGFGVGHIFEVGGTRALGGAAQGTIDGRTHDAWADRCGAPPWVRLIYVAQDAPLTIAQLRGPVTEYARAFDAACRRPTMPYGPYDCLEVLCGENHVAPYGWQSAGMSGSGSGSGGSFRCNDGSVRRLSRYAALFQDVKYVLGGQADHNVTVNDTTVTWAWGGPYTGDASTPDLEDDDVQRPKILWTQVDSEWRRRTARLPDRPEPYAFVVYEAVGTVKFLADDDETNWIRFRIGALGGRFDIDGKAPKEDSQGKPIEYDELHDVPDVVFRTLTLVGARDDDDDVVSVPTTPGTVDTAALVDTLLDEAGRRLLS